MCLKVLTILSYLWIIAGSMGMVVWFHKFPSGTSPVDLKYATSRWCGLNVTSYRFWMGSWALIILGTLVQLALYVCGIL